MNPVEIEIQVLPSYYGYIIWPKVLLSIDGIVFEHICNSRKTFGFLICNTTPHH